MLQLSRKQRKSLACILASSVGLIILLILQAVRVLPQTWYFRLPLFLLPYAPVAFDVWKKAIRNLFSGQVLDENFLMAIATVGAMVIGEYPEAVFVMLFYQVGELFESIAVGRSRRSIAALMDIRPDEARVERDGEWITVSPEEVCVGECILVRPGERIPLDAVVIEGKSELNTSALTGESLPREVSVGDEVISGCVNVSGLLRLRTTKPFSESTVSRILELAEHSAMSKSKAENAVTKFARWYTPSVVVTALILAILPSLITGDWQRWLHTSLIFLVVSCPCALVISVPLSYFGGLGAASRSGVLVKGSNRLEMLADAETVVFDKTGTLTEGIFALQDVQAHAGIDPKELLIMAARAEAHSNHPIAKSIKEAITSTEELVAAESVNELSGRGVYAQIDGHTVLVGNERLMTEREIVMDEMPNALGTAVFVAVDGCFWGRIVIADRIRSDAAEALASLRSCGVKRLVMLSGDRKEVAEDVAKTLSLDTYRAELLPDGKVEAFEELVKEKSGSVAFVGDGVNDAPVLARADIGIAMGAMGSDAAIEAADVVLMEDKLSKLSFAVRLARFTRRIVHQNIAFAVSVKLIFMILGILGMTNLWLATFADVGVAVIAILNAMKTLRFRQSL